MEEQKQENEIKLKRKIYYNENKIIWKISYLIRKIDGKIIRKSPAQIKQEKYEKKLAKFKQQLREEGLID